MAQAKPRLLTFQDFLAYDDSSDRCYELLNNGDLIELPPESELNSWIAKVLGMALEQIVSPRLVRTHSITLEVEPIGDDRKNHYPRENSFSEEKDWSPYLFVIYSLT